MATEVEIDDEEAIRPIRILADKLGVDEEEAVLVAVTERLARLKAAAGDKRGEPGTR